VTRIVLASESPRRRSLLVALGIDLEVRPSDAPEHADGSPESIVVENACAKRDDIAAQFSDPAVVIAADTLVFLGNETLGKPSTLDEARDMLRRLSGRTHRVITGIAVRDTKQNRDASGSETTLVTFRELTDCEIDRFVAAVRPLDRAGAYTVDGPGTLLVEKYEGCYQNVLGLPIVRLDQLLRSIGHSLFDWMNPDKSVFL
jgi:septum formation protein